MAISKVERLMNLVIALLSTRQYLTAEKIRASVAGYDDSTSMEAFSRMFERDKSELRDLGIPLETGPAGRYSSTEGYRINRDAYELPDIGLTSEESAAVAVAVQFWESPELASVAQGALLKLRAAGIQVDSESIVEVPAVPARSRGSEPALSKLLTAIDAGQAVRFQHRGAANEPYRERNVQPWGVVTRRGRWYLVGYDVDRAALRTFRISRIEDDVVPYGPPGAVRKPDDFDLWSVVDRVTEPRGISGTATVWVAAGRAQDLRRLGRQVGDRRIGSREGTLLEVDVRSWDWLARLITGHGGDALVLEPSELRDDVIQRLKSVAL